MITNKTDIVKDLLEKKGLAHWGNNAVDTNITVKLFNELIKYKYLEIEI